MPSSEFTVMQDLKTFVEWFVAQDAPGGIAFTPHDPIFIARAPGRLDVMGGIADYSGSLVLQLPIAEAALAAVQRDSSPALQIASLCENSVSRFSMAMADFLADGAPVSYAAARRYFQTDSSSAWAAYVAGAFLVLMREKQMIFHDGARILIDSRVPQGKGVSSSAALEVASMQAIAAAFEIPLETRELALLCQKVENLVVGAPCGVMDQMTAACGQQGQLLALLCQPAEILGTSPIPEDLAVWGIDSGLRHSVSGADYGSVRIGAFMGYRMISVAANLAARKKKDVVEIEDPRWDGYLANLAPSEFEQFYTDELPDRMSGEKFLKQYAGITDPVTRVDPRKDYAVKAPTAHPIYEHFRVRAFAELLRGPGSERQRELLGELMFQSHASYSACGLGSEGTDLLVSLVREIGATGGLYGAKITGGGSGGTVAVLGHRDAGESVRLVVSRYERMQGHKPYLFQGSSPGAAAYGCSVIQDCCS